MVNKGLSEVIWFPVSWQCNKDVWISLSNMIQGVKHGDCLKTGM